MFSESFCFSASSGNRQTHLAITHHDARCEKMRSMMTDGHGSLILQPHPIDANTHAFMLTSIHTSIHTQN
jgi:hypothetical protein